MRYLEWMKAHDTYPARKKNCIIHTRLCIIYLNGCNSGLDISYGINTLKHPRLYRSEWCIIVIKVIYFWAYCSNLSHWTSDCVLCPKKLFPDEANQIAYHKSHWVPFQMFLWNPRLMERFTYCVCYQAIKSIFLHFLLEPPKETEKDPHVSLYLLTYFIN